MALCVLEFYCVQIYAIFSKPPSRINIFFDNICRDYFSFSRYFPDRQAGMYGSCITEKGTAGNIRGSAFFIMYRMQPVINWPFPK